jgi:hypothetical protein
MFAKEANVFFQQRYELSKISTAFYLLNLDIK